VKKSYNDEIESYEYKLLDNVEIFDKNKKNYMFNEDGYIFWW